VSDPQGLAFDALAEDYDLGRPPWPSSHHEGVHGPVALDLAAGTGKLTSLLVERFDVVHAVEPLAGMRSVLERNVPAANVVAGSAERIPLDDSSVDAAFVAEAFHWFDSHAAVRELARVLRSSGTLVVCFNDYSLLPQLPEAFRSTLRDGTKDQPAPGGPKVQSGEWRRGFDGAPFDPLEEEHHRHEWSTTRESLAAYFVSTSSMGSMPEDERAALRGRLVELLPATDYRIELIAHAFRTLRA